MPLFSGDAVSAEHPAQDLKSSLREGALPEREAYESVVRHVQVDSCMACRTICLQAGWWPAGCKAPQEALEVVRNLEALLDPGEGLRQLRDHVEGCMGCSAYLEEFRQFSEDVEAARRGELPIPVGSDGCTNPALQHVILFVYAGQDLPSEERTHLAGCQACQDKLQG